MEPSTSVIQIAFDYNKIDNRDDDDKHSTQYLRQAH